MISVEEAGGILHGMSMFKSLYIRLEDDTIFLDCYALYLTI